MNIIFMLKRHYGKGVIKNIFRTFSITFNSGWKDVYNKRSLKTFLKRLKNIILLLKIRHEKTFFENISRTFSITFPSG